MGKINGKKAYGSGMGPYIKGLFGLILPAYVWTSTITNIDNEIVGNPVVDCQETMVSITFKTKKPFNGRVYVQGMADDERCSRNFASNSDQSKFVMMIQNGDCTMQRQRVTGTLEGVMLTLTIVVSFHGTFVTKSDRAFRCMCFFKNVKHLTNAIDVNLIGTTDLLDTAITPSCLYQIHAQSPDGPPVGLGKVGDKIYHVWQCDDPTHGFLVHSCAVDDGRGNKFDLLDVDGCAIDPIIQPDVVYEKDKNRASVETFGYKFSDTTILNYQCTIELCKKSSSECEGLTPPICGKTDTKAIRAKQRRRSITVFTQGSAKNRTNGDMKIDLSASLNIIDTVYENSKSELMPPSSILQNKTLNTVELVEQRQPDDSAVIENCVWPMITGFVLSLVASASLAVILAIVISRRRFLSKTF